MNNNREESAARLSFLGGSRFAQNVSWNILGNVGGKLAGPLFQVLIARLVLPEDYGVFAIALAWLAAFEVVKDWGFTQAIVVRRGGRKAIALQFTVQLGTALCFYVVTLVAAPIFVVLLDQPELRVVLPLVGLAAFVGAVADPLITECLSEQHYRRLALRQMVAALVSGAIGLLLAYLGFGVYALVGGLLIGSTAGALSLLLAAGARGRLSLLFEKGLTRDLLGIGKHVMMQRLFGFLVNQADSFIVGRALGVQALGIYRLGNLLAFIVPGATVSQAQQVVFTDLSATRDPEAIRARYNRYVDLLGPVLLVYSVAAYLAAPSVVPALLGQHWRDTVPLVQIFVAVVITGYLTSLNNDLAKVLGFIDVYTRFAAVRSVVTIVSLAVAAQYSLVHVVTAWSLVALISNIANDALFHARQDIVPLTRRKAFLIAISWVWAGFAINGVLR